MICVWSYSSVYASTGNGLHKDQKSVRRWHRKEPVKLLSHWACSTNLISPPPPPHPAILVMLRGLVSAATLAAPLRAGSSPKRRRDDGYLPTESATLGGWLSGRAFRHLSCTRREESSPGMGQMPTLAVGLENEHWEGCSWDSRWFNSPCDGRISTGSFLLSVWQRDSHERAFLDRQKVNWAYTFSKRWKIY